MGRWGEAGRRRARDAGLLACVWLACAAGATKATAGGDAAPIPAAGEHAQGAPAQTSPALVRLGRALFFDPRLSVDGSTSCATCHDPAHYFSDGRAVSRGVGGRTGFRNAPSLLEVSAVTTPFWDGRVDSLEAQAAAPLVNPREMAMPNRDAVAAAVRQADGYRPLFTAAFGTTSADAIDIPRITGALAAYERTLRAGNSRFDREAFGGETGLLSASEERGRRLFTGMAGCTGCHVIGPTAAPLSDDRFHSLAVGLQPIADRLAALTLQVAAWRREGRTPDQIVQAGPDYAALGRFVVTLRPADLGAFRTPSLRNVAMTAPYMHDGSVATLREAVDDEVYYRSSERGRPLLLTPRERGDLVAFLGSLSTPLDDVLAQAPTARPRAAAAN